MYINWWIKKIWYVDTMKCYSEIKRKEVLLLSHFSHVRLCATPETAAYQAPLSLGFCRQEHWSGLPFPSPMHQSEKSKWTRSVAFDSSRSHGLYPPGSSIHGIFQARVLEWGAIAFSESDFGAPQNKVSHCFHCFPIYLPWSDGPDAMVLFCWIKVINSWGEGNLPSKRSQKLFSLVGNHKLWSEYQIDIKISLLLIKIL